MATTIGLARMSRNHAYGAFSVNFTVYLSTASTLSTELRSGALAWPFVVMKRLIVYTTSSATSSRPFIGGFGCHFTPRRSLKMYVVSFGCVHDSARSGSMGNVPGVTDGPVFVRTRRLCVKVIGMWSLYESPPAAWRSK